MTIGSSVLAILKILRGWGDLPAQISGLGKKLDAIGEIKETVDAIKAELDTLDADIHLPHTGDFNPNPKDPTMSVLQMTMGDPPHTGVMTFSEAGAPSDGAVFSDNPAVANVEMDADRATWHVTAIGPGTANITYTGTSDPPDVGPVVVEPMVITVIAAPVAETGQFNP